MTPSQVCISNRISSAVSQGGGHTFPRFTSAAATSASTWMTRASKLSWSVASLRGVFASCVHRRFARLRQLYTQPPIDLLPVGTAFQIGRRGEDARFDQTALRVPAGALRDRKADVLSPQLLARQHTGYRNRVMMGPTWRADVWTVLQKAPEVTASEAARQAGSSFATAWQVVRDFRLLRPTEETERQSG